MATRPESVFAPSSILSPISSEAKRTNPNTLFNFLTSYLDHPLFLDFISKHIGTLKKSAPDEPSFYQFDLTPEKRIIDTADNIFLRQQSQQIRFYKTNARTPSMETRDHYTAVFVSHVTTEYKLQIYFDIHDTTELIHDSMLYIKDNEGQFQPMPSMKGFESLKNLSAPTLVKTVMLLRQELASSVQVLEKKYYAVEDELSSDEILDIEDAAYLDKLGQINTKLDELLAQSNYPYQSLHGFIQFMIKQFQLLDSKLDSPLSPVDTEIDDLLSHFASLTDDIPTSIETICPLLEKIHDVFLSLKDETVTASLLSLKKLLKLHIKLYDKSERMLLECIEEHQFELARKLAPFYCFLSMEHLVFALKAGDAPLLAFLLDHGNFYITAPLFINNIHYPSAAHFCLDHDSEQNPMAACLSVLMQNKNSAMVINAEGLPLAYIILSSTNHPLSHAFFADENTLQNTVGSVHFYQQLIEALTKFAHSTTDANTKSMVLVEIAFYNKQIERIKMGSAMPAVPDPYTALDFNKEHDAFIKEHLQKEARIVKLKESLEQLTAKHQFHAINKYLSSKAYIEHLILPTTTYVLMRCAVIMCLHDLQHIVEKKVKLDEIRKAVNKPFLQRIGPIKYSLDSARGYYGDICVLAEKHGIPNEVITMDPTPPPPPPIPKRLLQLSDAFYAPRTPGSFFDLNAFINASAPSANCVPGEDDEQDDNPLLQSITIPF